MGTENEPMQKMFNFIQLMNWRNDDGALHKYRQQELQKATGKLRQLWSPLKNNMNKAVVCSTNEPMPT